MRSQKNRSMTKRMFLDKPHRVYRNDESDDEGSVQSSFPDFSALMKTEKKKVFRDHNHIYFRCDVTMERVNQLCNLIEEYNREHESLSHDLTTSIVIPKPIYLHITSFGGDLLAGFLAYDYIKNSKIPVYTVAEGYAVSSGANMFMGGHKRFMTENSYILIHQLNVTKYGSETFHDMIDAVSNDIEFMTRLYGIFLNNIRHHKQNVPPQDILTKEKLENHMMHDIYWNYDACKRYGLVDALYTNYFDTDIKDVQQYLESKVSNSIVPHKVYSLEELKPSDMIVKKIKENLIEQKNNDMVEMVKKHIAKRLTTDGNTGLMNHTPDHDEVDMGEPKRTLRKRHRSEKTKI